MLENPVTLLVVTLALVEVMGIMAAVDAVMKARTSQGAIAWTVSLVSIPFLALPLYFVFGQRKFHGYVKARRSGDMELAGVPEEIKRNSREILMAPLEEDRRSCRALEQLAKMPFTRGNGARLLVDGEETFEAIFQGIEEAREYVLVQFYIVKDDGLGRELKSRLVRKAGEGVRVLFLYDQIGSFKLPQEYISELSEAGVEVRAFKSTRRLIRRTQVNFRNHRKIVVADGRTAFVGGHNVGDEYLGKDPVLHPWRDTHVQVTGPVVLGVQLAFLEDWFWAAREIPELNWKPLAAPGGDLSALALPTGPNDGMETCALFFVEAAHAARERAWIVSPYFVPDRAVMSALQLAALRGVDVRVMIPANPDHKLVYLAGFSYLGELGQAGVKFYRYKEGFLHQKVMLVDDDMAAVGTANLDNRSLRLNFEITLLFLDRPFAREVEAMLEKDFSGCDPVDPYELEQRSFPFRLGVQLARLMAPVL